MKNIMHLAFTGLCVFAAVLAPIAVFGVITVWVTYTWWEDNYA